MACATLRHVAYKDPLDPRCRAARLRHYAANPEQYRAREMAKRERVREFLNGVKAQPCMDCGGELPYYVMDLDHRPGEIKLYTPSRLHQVSMRAAIAEVAKCDVVCANCHRIRTNERRLATPTRRA